MVNERYLAISARHADNGRLLPSLIQTKIEGMGFHPSRNSCCGFPHLPHRETTNLSEGKVRLSEVGWSRARQRVCHPV